MKSRRGEKEKKALRERIATAALGQLGKPYKYGARWQEAPKVFDCSSFSQWAYKQAGIDLPRLSIEQAAIGRRIRPEIGQLKTADLIFLRSRMGRYNEKFPAGIGHVVLVTGPDQFVHASSRKRGGRSGRVRLGKLSRLLRRRDITVVKRVI